MIRRLLCLLGFHKFKYLTAQEICPIENNENTLIIKKGALLELGTGRIPEVKVCEVCGAKFIDGVRKKLLNHKNTKNEQQKDLYIKVEKQVWESTLNRSMKLQAENETLKELLKECREVIKNVDTYYGNYDSAKGYLVINKIEKELEK